MKQKALMLGCAMMGAVATNAQVWEGQQWASKTNSILYDVSNPNSLGAGTNDYKIRVGFLQNFSTGKRMAHITGTYDNGTVEQYLFANNTPLNFTGDYEFVKVIQGSNKHYYALGWAIDNSAFGTTNKVGIICEFTPTMYGLDPTVTLVANNVVIATGKDLTYTDLTEVPGGAGGNFIAAVGWEHDDVAGDAAIVTEFTTGGQCPGSVALTEIWSKTFADPHKTARFNAVTATSTGIILAGGYNTISTGVTGNAFDGVITAIQSGCTAPTIANSFQYTATGLTKLNSSPAVSINAISINKLINGGLAIWANSSLSNGLTPTAEDGLVIQIKPALNAINFSIQYGDLNNLISNSVPNMFNPLSSTTTSSILVGISPGATVLDNYSYPASPYSTAIMEIKQPSTIILSKITGTNQTLRTAVRGTNIYCGGFQTNGTVGNMFDVFGTPNFSPTTCLTDYATSDKEVQTHAAAINWQPVAETLVFSNIASQATDGNTYFECGTPVNKDNDLVVDAVNSNTNSGTLTVFPNPAPREVYANYTISNDFKTASLRLVDNLGQTINNINLTEKSGKIKLNVGDGSASGQYTYILTVDGKMVATEKVALLK